MATKIPYIVTYIYKEINEGKFKSVKHYELITLEGSENKLSDLLNISKNQNCAQSTPIFWLKVRQGNKWSRCLTGLFKTEYKNIYKGDLERKKHLIIFKFNENANTLKISYFNNYYTRDISKVLPYLNE